MNQAKTKAKWIEQRKMEKTCQRKKDRHNREPTQQSYYWGSGLLMDYFLEKNVRVQCFDKIKLRDHIFGKCYDDKVFRNTCNKW